MTDNTKKKHGKGNTQSWKRMSFKGNKVWAAIEPDGHFVMRNDKVLVKYNLKQDYEYLIKKDNLKPENEAVPGKRKKKKSISKNISDTNKNYDTRKGTCNKNTKNKNACIRDNIPDNSPDTENTIVIYTDGASSGNPGPAGIGAVLVFNGHQKRISEFIGIATNNIAELTAIETAVKQLKRRDIPVRLFTDSTYCAGVLSKGWKPKKNIDLIMKIKKLINKFKDFKIIKVKGHAGIELNEIADNLATSAIEKQKQKTGAKNNS